MSNVNNLEQQIASLQINHGDDTNKSVKTGKKIGPAVPPKPKKAQPQVNFVYSLFFCHYNSNLYIYSNDIFNISFIIILRQQWTV